MHAFAVVVRACHVSVSLLQVNMQDVPLEVPRGEDKKQESLEEKRKKDAERQLELARKPRDDEKGPELVCARSRVVLRVDR